ncbi:MAG TPA: hypothetical protein VLN56_04765 [Gammaproteobacteria bacterium]|nr:hypothetical protein [Gammaproteobacteria bacterium]
MLNWLSQNKNELADVEKHWQKNGLFRKKKEMNKTLLLFGLFIGNLALLGMLFIVA